MLDTVADTGNIGNPLHLKLNCMESQLSSPFSVFEIN